MGIFFFESGDPPIRTYGGKALFGADAELLCIAHAQLAVRMIGAKIAGDLKLKGRGDVNIEIGSCPFCIEFSAGVNMGLLYGLWYMDL